MILLCFPVSRLNMPVKQRKETNCGAAAGETTTHDATYSGVAPMSWASMTSVTDADKAKILGVTAGTIKKPRAKVFDTSFGQPGRTQDHCLLADIVRGRRRGNDHRLLPRQRDCGESRTASKHPILRLGTERTSRQLFGARGGPTGIDDDADCREPVAPPGHGRVHLCTLLAADFTHGDHG